MSAWKLEYAIDKCVFRVVEQALFKKMINGARVRDPWEVRAVNELLDFRSKIELAADLRVIKRLHAETVACAEQTLFLSIPKRKSKHPVEVIDTIFSPLLITS